MQAHTLTAAAVAAGFVVTVVACGGGSSPTSPPGGGSNNPATVTITANGVTPKTIEISAGQQVRFVNNDGTAHEMLSTPHLSHTDCPAINVVGTLSPGSNRFTDSLTTVRICGFHDHRNPDDDRFRGQINVGTNTGPGPGYIRP
jgi:plastocyanin